MGKGELVNVAINGKATHPQLSSKTPNDALNFPNYNESWKNECISSLWEIKHIVRLRSRHLMKLNNP